jgi:hypothetical protein
VGRKPYSLAWPKRRVRFHLDPDKSVGQVFVAEFRGAIVGHTIVRIERTAASRKFGQFSTTYNAALGHLHVGLERETHRPVREARLPDRLPFPVEEDTRARKIILAPATVPALGLMTPENQRSE